SPGSLAEKIRSDVDVTPLLAAVQTAATLEEALARRDALANHESIITPDGAWIGRNWLSLEYAAGNQRGWLAREREIETIERECAERRAEIERLAAELGDGEIEIAGLERRREELGHEQERLHQIETRNAQVARERAELESQLARHGEEIATAKELLQQAASASDAHEARRLELQTRREAVQERLNAGRTGETDARERAHRVEIESRTVQTALESTRASITRLESQLGNLR